MSDFSKAVEFVLANEGGYSNDPNDRGGETSFGISQRWLDQMGFDIRARDVTRDMAISFYRDHWWDEYTYGEIEDQELATKVLDMAVVAGPAASHLCLQRALLACRINVRTDGVLGPITRSAVTQAQPCCLRAAFRSEQAGYFRDLDRPVFERGWVARAYR